MRKWISLLVAGWTAAFATSVDAWAQAAGGAQPYPNKPIRLIVAFPQVARPTSSRDWSGSVWANGWATR